MAIVTKNNKKLFFQLLSQAELLCLKAQCLSILNFAKTLSFPVEHIDHVVVMVTYFSKTQNKREFSKNEHLHLYVDLYSNFQ